MRILTLAFAGLISGTAAQAAGDALVIGNSSYNGVQTLFAATQVAEAAEALREQGFDVTEARDAGGPAMSEGFSEFVAALEGDDGPVIMMLAGAFLHGANGAYLLPASDGAALSDTAVMLQAFPLDAAMSVLAKYPGRAFLVLSESAVTADFGDFLDAGIGDLEVPSGVTVLSGPESAVSRFAAGELAKVGQPVVAAAQAAGVTVDGFAPGDLVVVRATDVPTRSADEAPAAPVPAETATPATPPEADEAPDVVAEATPDPESATADSPETSEENAVEAVETAESMIDEAEATEEAEQAAEADAAPEVMQEAETADAAPEPTEADAAPEATQEADAADAAEEADAADAAPEAAEEPETAELAQEADAAPEATQEAEAADTAPEAAEQSEPADTADEGEDDTKTAAADSSDTEAEGDTRSEVEIAADEGAWRAARIQNSEASYQSYLIAQPEGSYVSAATQRIKAIKADPFYDLRRAEDFLGLDRDARRDIQRNLDDLGHYHWAVDGIFGEGTRDAVRSWQTAQGLEATGYLDLNQIAKLQEGAEAEEAKAKQQEARRNQAAAAEARRAREKAAAAEKARAEARRKAAAQAKQKDAARSDSPAPSRGPSDAAMWAEVERLGSEQAVRRYLNAYPNGARASRARQMLQVIERMRGG
ncbi:peptidoglycan hydrolase-like protein with peptidoglycan-binding domain [Sagittula marina]|uniref:Peptidoglycan hydrolase-like protein with peptidoglycan-binding domain n=1 Tax=Sagittula marina TaxID=943940 RepID=A0A7W6DRM3_9RHOB|nr:peptidoglycan-binding protein [Sagittula marina]MBB3984793.1 peptidoglycan hydrolase-like protein with peptidoglycan-binding domain [Sagittula marina]